VGPGLADVDQADCLRRDAIVLGEPRLKPRPRIKKQETLDIRYLSIGEDSAAMQLSRQTTVTNALRPLAIISRMLSVWVPRNM
jgi:hypothetical protein